jgi:hypothetical protein
MPNKLADPGKLPGSRRPRRAWAKMRQWRSLALTPLRQWRTLVFVGDAMNAVAETTVFATKAAALLTDAARASVIEMLARNPECGAVIPGTGGVRKIRIALEGRGKSGGARVVYYFQNDRWPIIVLTIYAKNEKANLSVAERNALAKMIAELKTARAHKESTP